VRSPSAFAIRSLLLLVVVGAGVAAAIILGRGTPNPPANPPATTARIVSLSPAIAVMLRDLGLQDRIVGRDGYDMVLPASVPVCGDLQGIDYERLMQVRPTHILLQLGARAIPDRLTELTAAQGWKAINYPLLTLDDIRSVTQELGRTFGTPAAPLVAEMDRAWSRRGVGFAGAGRVLLMAGTDPPSAFGPGSCHHQVLERIGGTPAIREGAVYITLDAEDVLKLQPDAIILILPRSAGAASPRATVEQVRATFGRLAQLDIPAFKNSRMAMIDDPLAHTPSTAMIQLADDMAGILADWNETR